MSKKTEGSFSSGLLGAATGLISGAGLMAAGLAYGAGVVATPVVILAPFGLFAAVVGYMVTREEARDDKTFAASFLTGTVLGMYVCASLTEPQREDSSLIPPSPSPSP